jgi:hypothetical protein
MNNNSGFNQDNRRINNTNNFYATPQPGGQQYFPTRNMLPNNLSISDINAMPTLLPHLQNMAAVIIKRILIRN